ncbi:uncharacterized protein EURHEDRAFT_524047 [Aspergillus ruber CBS 135680]|uniref:Uncharacterized protein n=1 Tax=Aspergillus ruber (strain CBS 135680) TaxID=1388766 RepID=A0A017SC66_ASPRC|nr:uncharacterized protein EURHEDRAFT_524047 [Aspergillus ruber CBS 135680]EYE94229.1 hypothetical protein EURHEDRAFT_524047 [Aspergillus ruber CBS 135680]
MKFTGIAAMLAVVTAVTGAAIPNVNGALAEVHQVTGDVQGLLSKALGTKDEAQVNKLVSQLQNVEKLLKQLSGGEEKRQLADIGVGANVNVLKRDGILGDLTNSLPLDNIKRDDAISGLAEQITPQVTQVIQGLNVQQVTGLLNILNVNGLLTNVESVLDNLLGGGLLKGLTGGLLGGILKRDDAISSLATQLLPKLTKGGILPEDLNVEQLTGLLNVLNVNNLLTGVEGLVQGLLGGLPLKGLTGNLL